MVIHFTKLSATGNDFILVDNREVIFLGNEVRLFRRLCERRTGIGADGILLIENNPSRDFTMRYFNADGCESEMCGNGARATAYFAFRSGMAEATMSFEVSHEPYEAVVRDRTVRLHMRKPHGLRLQPGVLEDAGMTEGGVVNTGVPHYVLFVDEVDRVPVLELGRKYRHHPRFAPAGTNVNFVQLTGPSQFKLRTFERGVEDETLACGTGTVASAVILHLKRQVPFPFSVSTRGGALRVQGDPSFENLELEGEVQEVFSGQFTLEDGDLTR